MFQYSGLKAVKETNMRPFQYIATIQSKSIDEQIAMVKAQFGITKKEAREYVQAYWMKA